MGRKANPIILRKGNLNEWKYKYIEKKSNETALYNFKSTEIEKFINKFFQNYGFTVKDCKILHSNNNFNVFISYYLTTKTLLLIQKTNQNENIKIVSKKIKETKTKQKIKQLSNSLFQTRLIKYKSKKTKSLYSHYLLNKQENSYSFNRTKFLRIFKHSLLTKKLNNSENIKNNMFSEKLLTILRMFLKTPNVAINLRCINKDLNKNLDKKELKSIKSTLPQLQRYKDNEFFKDGLNILFKSTIEPRPSNLLAKFIASKLGGLKKHNFFLRFLSTTLKLFLKKKNSKIKSIKIQVKGRLNGTPRHKIKRLHIGNPISNSSINSDIDYTEETSFTKNGSLGIKVWTC